MPRSSKDFAAIVGHYAAERLRKLLSVEFDVIASVEDGRAMVDAAARLSPDVIVADIAMPRLDGIAAAIIIRGNNTNARIVLVTVHSEPMLVEAGLAAGTLGYGVEGHRWRRSGCGCSRGVRRAALRQ